MTGSPTDFEQTHLGPEVEPKTVKIPNSVHDVKPMVAPWE